MLEINAAINPNFIQLKADLNINQPLGRRSD